MRFRISPSKKVIPQTTDKSKTRFIDRHPRSSSRCGPAKAPLTFYPRERGAPAAKAIIVPAGSPIRSVADPKGETVGVSRGSGSHYVLAAANSRRTYAVEPVERGQLGEQQAIADVFYEAKLIPRRIDATDVPIFQPPVDRG